MSYLRLDCYEHYINDSSSDAWRMEMIAMETEGERTPAQPPQPMVRIADTWVTQETADEFFAEVA